MLDAKHWAHRSHPGPRAVLLELSSEQRADLEMAMRPDKAEVRVVRRAQAALLMADDVATVDIAKLVGVHPRTVEKWRVRFRTADPVERIADAPRSGRPRALSRKPTALESKPRLVDHHET
jgi:hypothetical protein